MANERRVRKVNVDTIPVDQIDNLSEQLGDKVSVIINKASEDINKILNIYGLQIMIQYNLKEMDINKSKK